MDVVLASIVDEQSTRLIDRHLRPGGGRLTDHLDIFLGAEQGLFSGVGRQQHHEGIKHVDGSLDDVHMSERDGIETSRIHSGLHLLGSFPRRTSMEAVTRRRPPSIDSVLKDVRRT